MEIQKPSQLTAPTPTLRCRVWMKGLCFNLCRTFCSFTLGIHSGPCFGTLDVFQGFESKKRKKKRKKKKRFVLLDYIKSKRMQTLCLCVFCSSFESSLEGEAGLIHADLAHIWKLSSSFWNSQTSQQVYLQKLNTHTLCYLKLLLRITVSLQNQWLQAWGAGSAESKGAQQETRSVGVLLSSLLFSSWVTGSF